MTEFETKSLFLLERIAKAVEGRPATSNPAASPAANRPTGAVFPNYGRSKGAPVAGATTQDLEFYANGCRRSLDDPSKARWHDKERALLAAIEQELARPSEDTPPHTDADAPPPDETPF